MSKRRLDRPITTIAATEPDSYLSCSQVTRLGPSWTMRNHGQPAVISSESITPRSYIIKTQQGAELRRNRRHLQPEPVPQSSSSATSENTGTGTPTLTR